MCEHMIECAACIWVTLIRICLQALFSASFKAMERSFGFTPGKIGVLQMWQSLSFSLSLPVWGVFLPALGARYLVKILESQLRVKLTV